MPQIDRESFISLSLKHIALLNRLAGTHEGLGHLEEGRLWGRKAAAAREDLEAFLKEMDDRPVPEQAEDPCDTPQCCYYNPNEDPDLVEALRAGGIDLGAERRQPEFNHPEGFGKGARIRVFEQGEVASSEEGVVYKHDGADDLPWARQTPDSDFMPYLNSEHILRWEPMRGRQTNPPRGASKGDCIRVFKEDRHGDEVVSEKGIVYQHDGADDGDMPWCIVGVESADQHAYLESSDIKEWEVA